MKMELLLKVIAQINATLKTHSEKFASLEKRVQALEAEVRKHSALMRQTD